MIIIWENDISTAIYGQKVVVSVLINIPNSLEYILRTAALIRIPVYRNATDSTLPPTPSSVSLSVVVR